MRKEPTALEHLIAALLCYPLIGGEAEAYLQMLQRIGTRIASAPMQDRVRQHALAWIQLHAQLTQRYQHYSIEVVRSELTSHPILYVYVRDLPMLAELEPCWQVAEYWALVLAGGRK